MILCVKGMVKKVKILSGNVGLKKNLPDTKSARHCSKCKHISISEVPDDDNDDDDVKREEGKEKNIQKKASVLAKKH